MKRNNRYNGVNTHMESRKTSMPDCGLHPRVAKSDYRAIENTPEQLLLEKIAYFKARSETAPANKATPWYIKYQSAKKELEELRKEASH